MQQNIPRPEYPRPSWKRENWLNLNGLWDFAIDKEAVETVETVNFDRRILVPFCPEAPLSGIGETDFMEAVWYRTEVKVPESWRGQRLLLHFQAVDYDATVWIDGKETARHRGCFTPFTADLGSEPRSSFTVTVRAATLRKLVRPRGKQSELLENHGCCYIRTSGIWQTVWLEAVPEVRMESPRITPVSTGFHMAVKLNANKPGWRVEASASTEGRVLAKAGAAADAALMPVINLEIPEEDRRLWQPEDPFLYDLQFTLLDNEGRAVDTVSSYAGLRFITIDGTRLCLNGRPVFQKLVLDQGYYEDGIWTAPDEAALIRDIELSMAAGFNGARLHQKVFEERFLYHADRLGYLVWGEFGDWGCHNLHLPEQPPASLNQPAASVAAQWLEVIARDYNHPSIIGWCGVNETNPQLDSSKGASIEVLDDLLKAVFLAAKLADPTRPVIDVSGYTHRLPETDVYDAHDYGLPAEVEEHLNDMEIGGLCGYKYHAEQSVPWLGQPFFLSEIGGIGWPQSTSADSDFFYGDIPAAEDEFFSRLDALFRVIRNDSRVFGYCYTQLTDVYQEKNGLFYFDRTPKFPVERLAASQSGTAEYEKN